MAESLLTSAAWRQSNQSFASQQQAAFAVLTEVSYLTGSLLIGGPTADRQTSGLPGPAPALNITLKLAALVEGMLGSLVEGVSSAAGNQSAASRSSTVTIEAEGLRLTAASLPLGPQGPGQELGSLTAPPGVPLGADLPVSAIQAAAQASGENSSIGLTSVRWKALNPFGPATVGSGVGQQVVNPVGDVVSLTLTNKAGKPLVMQDLPRPIVLAIPIQGLSQDVVEQFLINGTFPQCRWFNQTTRTWDGDGCRTLAIQKAGTELLCSCTHLTTFGAFQSPLDLFGAEVRDFFEGLVEVLLYCASANALFSEEGLTALQTGEWARNAAASFFFVLVLLLGGAQLASWARDIHHREELKEVWADLAHVQWFDLTRALGDWWKFLREPSTWRSHFVRSYINLHVALRLGICQGTLDILEEAQRTPPGYQPVLSNSTQRSAWSLTAKVAQAARHMELQRDSVIDDFTLRSVRPRNGANSLVRALLFLRRLLKLWCRTFLAVHAWTPPLLIDIDSLASHRTLVVTLQLLGSVWCTALYFHASGTASAPWSPDECVTSNLTERLQLAVRVGWVSTLVASVPSALIYNMVGARPSPADHKQRKATVAISYFFFYVIGLGLCSFYFMFLASFLANVSSPSAQYWVLSAVFTVLSSVLMMPFLQGATFSTILVILLWRDPALPQQIFGTQRQGLPTVQEEKSRVSGGQQTGHRVIQVREAAVRTGPSLPGAVPDDTDSFAQVLPFP